MATRSIVSSVGQRLGEWIVDEAKFLYRVSDQVKQLQIELRRLQAFLKDAEAKKQHESERVKNCIAELRDVAYDTEDVIETYILEVASSRGSGDFMVNLLMRIACCLKELIALHKVGSEIEMITDRLIKIRESMQDYGIREIMDSEGSSSWQEKFREKRKSFGHEIEYDIVGLEHDIEYLVENLTDEKKNFQVVSICGMGGLGKTTLAKQVYHHSKVRNGFKGFAWVCVSQECQRKYVWQEIMVGLFSEPKSAIFEMTDEELPKELYNLLRNDKYLVVLDDIWSIEDWSLISHAFPHEKGSKIILTSRNEDVASHADPRELRIDSRMEELGKLMVKQCGGLPLAVRALGGVLAAKSTSAEWLSVHEKIKIYLAGKNHSSVSDVLSLSYDDLPDYLKECFLYLGHFPKDYEIDVEKVAKYWIAEGMITPVEDSEEDNGITLEDLAELYFEELVKRSMVLVRRRDIATSKIKTCRLHDLLRELCLSKAREEIYLQFISLHTQSSKSDCLLPLTNGKVRRLGIQLDYAFHLEFMASPHIRSLMCFKGQGWRRWLLLDPAFRNMKLLRVLDLELAEIEGGKLPEDVGGLIHLRYLSLRSADLKTLPWSIGNLIYLVTLDLRVIHPIIHVPNVIWKLQRLRHLYLPTKLRSKTYLDLGDLRNLQTLENFPVGKCDVRNLFTMKKLRSLSIYLSSRYRLSGEIITPCLGHMLNHLQTLTIHIDWYLLADRGLSGPPIDASNLLPSFVKLHELNLITKIGKLPDAHQLPADITSLTLEKCELEEDPMPIIGKLHWLRILKLSCKAFIRVTAIVCLGESFLQLLHLELNGLPYLAEWTIEEGAMPCLRHLRISECPVLRMLPEGIRFITSLQQVDLLGMPNSFTDKLVPGGDDYYKVLHIPYVKIPSYHYNDHDLMAGDSSVLG